LTKDTSDGASGSVAGRRTLTGLALIGSVMLGCAQNSAPELGTEGQKTNALTRQAKRVSVRTLGARAGTLSWTPAAPDQRAKDPAVTAQAFLEAWSGRRGGPSGAAPKWSVAGVTSARDRRVVSFAQSVKGVPVWQARTTVLLSADGQPRAVTGLPDLQSTLGEFELDSAEVAQLAWQHQRPDASAELEFVGLGADGLERFALKQALTSGPTLLAPMRVSRVYFPAAAGLIPAFAVVIGSQAAGQDRRGAEVVLSARDGSILAARTTLAAAHSYRVWTADVAGTPAEGPLASVLPYPTSEPSGFAPLPAVSQLVEVEGQNTNPDGNADPWLPPGATTTLGNNVDAYVDFQDPDGLSAGEFRAEVTSAGVFDHAYDLAQGPLFDSTQSSAAIVQAFYTANWLHDWYYDSGFDEAAMNAQIDNFGRGGLAQDVLTIQVQDAALNAQPGGNNANMYTPPDGQSPIMQVYVWSAPSSATTIEATPGGTFPSAQATFGPATFHVSGPLALVSDGTADTMDACQALTQDLTGKIALVRRGGCPFVQKADAATSAGAIGVIVADNAAGNPLLMDGVSAGAAPSLSTTQQGGDALVAALANGAVTVELARTAGVERDGALDGTIVAHEWAHYLQDRLAPCAPTAIDYNTYTFEPSQCHAMGEGGGDFVALHMLLGQDDDPAGVYPMAAYAAAALVPDLYYGLRRVPYSTSLDVDPLTFRHIEDGQALPAGVSAAGPNAEVHNAGEVWATMLFEVYAALLAAGSGSFEEIRRNMSDDLVLALSMMPYERTVLDARDALLAAIGARSESDAVAAAQAFAKRGAGSCAVAPPFDSPTNTGVVEDFELSPRLEVGLVRARDEECDNSEDGVLDAGETGALVVEIINLGQGPAVDASVTLSGLPTELAELEGAELVLDVPALGTVDAEFPITLGEVSGIVDASVTVSLESDGGCSPATAATRDFSMNYDLDEAGGKSDDFAVDLGAWTLLGADADSIWSRSGVGEAAMWQGDDAATRTSTALVSPEVEVSSSEPFTVTLTHRFSFEESDGTYWDGGVIEISEDDGATWVDASEYPGVDVGYGGAVTAGNPLSADTGSPRPAFVGESASYPSFESLTIDFGDELAGKTIRMAFRIGSDEQVEAPGWAIDDVSFEGVARGPFEARAVDTTAPAACPEPVSSGGTGGQGNGGSGASPSQATTGGQGNMGTGGGVTDGTGGAGAVQAPGGCGCRVLTRSPSPNSGGSVLGAVIAAWALLRRRRTFGSHRS
jgi:hypothetical protein